jgi:hypothetical protein
VTVRVAADLLGRPTTQVRIARRPGATRRLGAAELAGARRASTAGAINVGSAGASSGGRICRERDVAGRLPVLLLSADSADDLAGFADRPTAWVRRELRLAVLSTVSSSADSRRRVGSILKIGASLPASPVGCASLLAASASAVSVAAGRITIASNQRMMPISSTPAEVNSISGKRSISG